MDGQSDYHCRQDQPYSRHQCRDCWRGLSSSAYSHQLLHRVVHRVVISAMCIAMSAPVYCVDEGVAVDEVVTIRTQYWYYWAHAGLSESVVELDE